MPSKGIKVEVRPDMAFTRTVLLLRHGLVKLRLDAIKRYIAHSTATNMLKTLVDKIPSTKEYDTYRNSLKIVQSGEARNPIFAVASESDNAPIEEETDLIYFKPVKKKGKLDPLVEILMEFQPWTMRTLPFDVSDLKATMQTRRVTKRELLHVESVRKNNEQLVSQKLSEAGVKPPPKKADIPKEASAVPDLTYTALRLEFGLGRTKAVAHWRPAVQQASGYATSIFETDEVANALLDWKSSSWVKWRNLSADAVPTKAISAMGAFQTKVGA